jgi:hypothetical protein
MRGLGPLPPHEKRGAALVDLDEQLSDWLTKAAADPGYSPTLRGLGELAGYLPGGQLSWQIPGMPRHLQGMLGGGLLGAATGYGAGWLGSRLLPDSWDKHRLPRTMAMLGSMVGAAPGLAALASNAASPADSSGNPHSLLDDGLMLAPPPHVESYQRYTPTYAFGSAGPRSMSRTRGTYQPLNCLWSRVGTAW